MSLVKDSNYILRLLLQPVQDSHKNIAVEYMMIIADHKISVFEFALQQFIPTHSFLEGIVIDFFRSAYVRKEPLPE